jgi:hypothetical protein
MKKAKKNKKPTNLNLVGNSTPHKHRGNQLILVRMGHEEDKRTYEN